MAETRLRVAPRWGRVRTVLPIAWSLLASCLAAGPAAGQERGADASAATPIEQALIERQCTATRPTDLPSSDAFTACLSAELLTLRNDFGRDLSKLSSAERKTLDTLCSKVRAVEGRDGYVACVSAQLGALRARRGRSNQGPSEGTAAPAPSELPIEPPAPPPESPSWPIGWWIGAGALVAIGIAAGIFGAMKDRRPVRKCRVCGKDVPDGDLCQACRHEAAESLRRAASERADQQRAHEEDQRRQLEIEEAQRRERAREEDEARLRQLERARQEARVRQEEERRQREEEARQRSQTAAVAPDAFDPYEVLGVERGASREEIHAAYEAAKSKYDSDNVAHFGVELQQLFKAKAQAVERAFQMLTA